MNTFDRVAAGADKDKLLERAKGELRDIVEELMTVHKSLTLPTAAMPYAIDIAKWATREIRQNRSVLAAELKRYEELRKNNDHLQRQLKVANEENTKLKQEQLHLRQIRGSTDCYADDEHSHSSDGFCLTESDPIAVWVPGLPDRIIRAATAALEAFASGYREYGEGAADPLGLAGQWGDLHRKVAKLKPVFWEGDSARLTRETPQEVLRDIIGHALLALEMLERGMEGGR